MKESYDEGVASHIDPESCAEGRKALSEALTGARAACSGVKSLFLTLPIFHESFLLTSGFSPENEEISAPPPCGLLIGIYLFYENWSIETFRKGLRGEN